MFISQRIIPATINTTKMVSNGIIIILIMIKKGMAGQLKNKDELPDPVNITQPCK